MSISYAILGFLLDGPRSGYDLKKLFAASESLHWSGNNNQIYAALVQLHRDGLATLEVQQPAEGPARKVYSITGQGKQALRTWLQSEPDLPQLRIPILTRLIAADLLSAGELDAMLASYAEALRVEILGLEELSRRGTGPSFGTARQRYLWQRIHERSAAFYREEAAWVQVTRQTLKSVDQAEVR